jgi:hypothetical protein
VKDEPPLGKGFIKWLESESCQGIDKHVLVFCADLDEAELFEIAMEAIRFGIQSDS